MRAARAADQPPRHPQIGLNPVDPCARCVDDDLRAYVKGPARQAVMHCDLTVGLPTGGNIGQRHRVRAIRFGIRDQLKDKTFGMADAGVVEFGDRAHVRCQHGHFGPCAGGGKHPVIGHAALDPPEQVIEVQPDRHRDRALPAGVRVRRRNRATAPRLPPNQLCKGIQTGWGCTTWRAFFNSRLRSRSDSRTRPPRLSQGSAGRRGSAAKAQHWCRRRSLPPRPEARRCPVPQGHETPDTVDAASDDQHVGHMTRFQTRQKAVAPAHSDPLRSPNLRPFLSRMAARGVMTMTKL